MFQTECSNCGERVPIQAPSCAHCGAANRARPAAIAIAAALAVLVIALVVTAVLVLRKPASDAGVEVPAGPQTPQAVADFGWLKTAMAACDADAEKDPATLEFLVIPLATPTADDAQWRTKSLNDIGNGTLLTSDDSLEALESLQLKVSKDEYVFAIRDDATGVIYKWKPSTGVVRFSTPDSNAIESFKIQFHTAARTDDTKWGAAFGRRKGTCYWVNAIVGN